MFQYFIYMLFVSVISVSTNLMAVQEGLTSIRVTWTTIKDSIGYRIYYSNGNISGSVTISGGFTNNYLLTGLQNGRSFAISIVAISFAVTPQRITNIILRMLYIYIYI